MKFKKYICVLILFTGLFITACEEDGVPGGEMMGVQDSFDRSALLTVWTDDIIMPAFENYQSQLENLRSSKDDFLANQNFETLENLRENYLEAARSWQRVSMFDIGMAESIGLRNFTNIFPTDVQGIQTNISTANFNLELPSNFDTQGFPALDYLLYGTGDGDGDILDKISDSDYRSYIDALVNRLADLNQLVLDDWQNGFREDFIANNGGSATASVDKLVNDFLFYYEKFLRAGKLGIPAGVFSGTTLNESVEAPFSQVYSKEFFEIGFQTVRDFFVGINLNGQQSSTSLADYLNTVTEANGTPDISTEILNIWEAAEAPIAALDNNLRNQVETDNLQMLMAYDAIQAAVPLLKVDMLQALNIQVDFVDADGD